ncbi:MAG TPA: ABC transporter ATP-binding protein [Planctomycetota bacterium]|nr:ABC transporter ATP-binding protein [Planctomycetota bacterium]
MIEVEGFGKDYDGLRAVADLSFSVQAGEILGLVGPNGAGKTTTLRAIAGILRPTRGRIRVAGHDLEREAVAAKRALAYVPDTPHPYDLLTVGEHLRFTALAYGVEDAEARAGPLLAELELLEKRDALASTLSRGMQQKLAIACAFLRDPRAILLDEPLTGLDPRGIRDMRESIRRRAEAGAAVLVSSHLLELVEKLGHRILILHRGARLALGTLGEIRAAAAIRQDATLEEAFFAITERGPAPPP